MGVLSRANEFRHVPNIGNGSIRPVQCVPKISLQAYWLLWERCARLWLSGTFYFIIKMWVLGIVCLFKRHFISQSLLVLWNSLHKQPSSERRARHLTSAKWEIWSWSALSSLCKFVLPSLRLWLGIHQNTAVVWGQEGWQKANLSHLDVHLKCLIREVGLTQVWNQSHQNTAATWSSWRLLRRWAEYNVHSAPTSSFPVWCAGHRRRLAQKSSLYFLALSSLPALEVSPLVQHLCCRAPSVGPSIWILYILLLPYLLEELQLGEGDSFWWEVGQPVKTNKASK